MVVFNYLGGINQGCIESVREHVTNIGDEIQT